MSNETDISAHEHHSIPDADHDLLIEVIAAAAVFANEARRAANQLPANQVRYSAWMTLEELQHASGVSINNLSTTLRGARKGPPDLMTLARLARAAGKTLKLTLGD